MTSCNPERIAFDDGDHLTITSTPDDVWITGHLNGADISLRMEHRNADMEGQLLMAGAADALWALPLDRAYRIGDALEGASIAPSPDSRKDYDSRALWDLANDPDVPTRVLLERLSRLTGIPVDEP